MTMSAHDHYVEYIHMPFSAGKGTPLYNIEIISASLPAAPHPPGGWLGGGEAGKQARTQAGRETGRQKGTQPGRQVGRQAGRQAGSGLGFQAVGSLNSPLHKKQSSSNSSKALASFSSRKLEPGQRSGLVCVNLTSLSRRRETYIYCTSSQSMELCARLYFV